MTDPRYKARLKADGEWPVVAGLISFGLGLTVAGLVVLGMMVLAAPKWTAGLIPWG